MVANRTSRTGPKLVEPDLTMTSLQAEKLEIIGFFNFSIIVKVPHNIQLLWLELNHYEHHHSIIMPQSEQ